MTWEERITRESAPAIRVEHELRYRLAAPIVHGSAVWADLGCGTAVAAAAGLAASVPKRAVLIDLDADAVGTAAAELERPDAVQLTGDLADRAVLAQIGEALLAVPGDRAATCFEVVEHLPTFVPLLEWSGELARQGAATFVISVPNDAFWSIENPFHLARWSEGAFEELRRLLPAEHTLLRQLAVAGSAVLDWEATPRSFELSFAAGGEDVVATHFIASYGPRHAELAHLALAAPVNQLDQRRWERQRESNLAVAEAQLETVESDLRAALVAQEQTLARQREELQTMTAQMEDWRRYIHSLERELGRPRSGDCGAAGP